MPFCLQISSNIQIICITKLPLQGKGRLAAFQRQLMWDAVMCLPPKHRHRKQTPRLAKHTEECISCLDRKFLR